MNTMGSHDATAVGTRGHNYVTGDDRRRFADRPASAESVAEGALDVAKDVARRARGWLFGSPLLTLAVIVGAGFLLSRLIESRR